MWATGKASYDRGFKARCCLRLPLGGLGTHSPQTTGTCSILDLPGLSFANSSLCWLFLASTFAVGIWMYLSACNKPDVFLPALQGGRNVVTGQLDRKMDASRGVG